VKRQARRFNNAGRPSLAHKLFNWACSGSDAEACEWSHSEQEILLRDHVSDLSGSVTLHAHLCAEGRSADCRELGRLYEFGLGVPQDYFRAEVYYSTLCDNGDAQGCSLRGDLYLRVSGVKDFPLALPFLTKACNAGDPRGCNGLGFGYSEGYGISRDYLRAATLFFNACDAGYANACANLGVLYQDGHGVEKNPSWSAVLFSQACDEESAEGCNLLAMVYDRGNGVRQDFPQAKALYEKACNGGSEDGCENLLGKLKSEHDDEANSIY
jgi:TPR repeat protein